MSLCSRVPVGRRRPGREAATAGDSGAVAVETAVALLGLVVVLGAVAWLLGVLATQLAAGEAARSAARAAARGDSTAAVRSEARLVLPGSDVSLTPSGTVTVVTVRRTVRPPGLLARWGAIEVVASATTTREQP
jgi:hypothetical protein